VLAGLDEAVAAVGEVVVPGELLDCPEEGAGSAGERRTDRLEEGFFFYFLERRSMSSS
jgi:hypothetical protein